MAFFCPENHLRCFQSVPLRSRRLVFSHGGAAKQLDVENQKAMEKVEELRQIDMDEQAAANDVILKTIDAHMLGVQDSVAAAVNDNAHGHGHGGHGPPPTPLGKKILNERVKKRLEGWVLHEMHHHHESQGLIGKAISSISEGIREQVSKLSIVRDFNAKNKNSKLMRLFTMLTPVQKHFKEEFGDKDDIDSIKAHLRTDLLTQIGTLHGPEKFQIQTVLGHPIPAAPMNDTDLTDLLLTGTFTQLSEIEKISHHGHAIFHGINAFDKLKLIRKFEVEETAATINMEKFNTERLQKVEGRLKNAADGTPEKEIYKLLTENILKEKGAAFFQLERNPTNLAFFADLELRLQNQPANDVLTFLTKVHSKMPVAKEKAKEGEEPPESVKNREEVKLHHKNFKDALDQLPILYATTINVNKSLYDAQKLVDDVRSQLGTAAAPRTGGTSVTESLTRASSSLNEARQKQLELQTKINNFEAQASTSATLLTAILNKGNTISPSTPQLLKLKNMVATLPQSTEGELFPDPTPPVGTATKPTFSAPNSAFIQYVKGIPAVAGPPIIPAVPGVTPLDLALLDKEIKEYEKKYLDPKMKVSTHQLLFLMKQADFEKDGAYNAEKCARLANISTNFAICDAKRANRHRAANNEIAESIIPGWRGRFRQAGQWLASKSFDSNVFEVKDIVDHAAGMDHAFEVFKGMDEHTSLNDMRQAIEGHGGMDNKKLEEFYLSLEEMLIGHNIGHHKKAEVADKAWGLEYMINKLEVLHAERASRVAIGRVLHPESDEEKKMSKSELMLRVIEEEAKAEKEAQKGIVENVSKLLRGFWSKTLGEDYKEQTKAARAYIKEHGLKGEAKKDYLKSLNLESAWNVLSAGLAVEEGLEQASRGSKLVRKWLGEKASAGGSATVEAVKGNAGTVLGGLGKGVKFVAWDAPTAVIKAPFQLTAWTAKKAFKAATWPFKTVWNTFSTSPEELAAMRAKYDAKKAHERAEWNAKLARRASKKKSHGASGHGGHDAHGGHGAANDAHAHAHAHAA